MTSAFTPITNTVSLLQERARQKNNEVLFRFLADGEGDEITLSYAELNRQAQNIAQRLLKHARPGDRALLLYPDGLEFIISFYACIYAGIIAVPAFPPKRNQKMQRLASIIDGCQPSLILTEKKTLALVQSLFEDYSTDEPSLILSTDRITDKNTDQQADNTQALPEIRSTDVAFLQYTSGSTGNPKGVIVSHSNLLANAEALLQATHHTDKPVGVSWLPLFHDMGLIGSVIQPLYTGFQAVLMPPTAFVSKPIRWLQAISKYKATFSGGPNIGYDYCLQSIKPEELADIDLSHWQIAASGAEPVRASTLEAFSKLVAGTGFSKDIYYPCYGMAEATLLISSKAPNEEPMMQTVDSVSLQHNKIIRVDTEHKNSQILISCGHSWNGHDIIIVDPETKHTLKEDTVGEVWVSGPSVAQGYWNKAEATEETFNAHTSDSGEGPFLRTGDLGYLSSGELYITGRIKDVLIIHGRNHYPQDIEQTVADSHEALMPNATAAFSIMVDGKEKLVVAQEVKRSYARKIEPETLLKTIRDRISHIHDVEAHEIILLKPARIAKTSSGKIQRHRCRQQFMANSLERLNS